ncbi:hypothetical protein KCP70_02745 [Salmonella enterica subsp. enterica]|nr:hypothetical protein KCP70_02745 [Salmonella enterica subsp. enterica]
MLRRGDCPALREIRSPPTRCCGQGHRRGGAVEVKTRRSVGRWRLVSLTSASI